MARTRSRTKSKNRAQNQVVVSPNGPRPRNPAQSRTQTQAGARAQAGARPGRAGTGPVAASPASPAGASRAVAATKVEAGPPAWLRITTLVLSVAGLGVSVYLTIAHYTTAMTLACPDTGTINCEKVTTSPESIVFGIPVAVLGLAFFVFMVAVNNPLAWRARTPLIQMARIGSVIAGMGFVLYLVYAELFKIGNICLWCTSVHVLTFALFVLILLSAALWGIRDTAEST